MEQEKQQQDIDTQIELIKHVGDIHSREIGTDISSDFIYGKNDEKQQKYITEMANNAQIGRKILKGISHKITNWKFNQQKRRWEKTAATITQIENINRNAKDFHDTLMIKPTMITILNRNITSNPLLKLMLGASTPKDKEDEHEENQHEPTTLGKLFTKDKQPEE